MFHYYIHQCLLCMPPHPHSVQSCANRKNTHFAYLFKTLSIIFLMIYFAKSKVLYVGINNHNKGAWNSCIGLHWAFWGIILQGIFVRLATVYIHASVAKALN